MPLHESKLEQCQKQCCKSFKVRNGTLLSTGSWAVWSRGEPKPMWSEEFAGIWSTPFWVSQRDAMLFGLCTDTARFADLRKHQSMFRFDGCYYDARLIEKALWRLTADTVRVGTLRRSGIHPVVDGADKDLRIVGPDWIVLIAPYRSESVNGFEVVDLPVDKKQIEDEAGDAPEEREASSG